MIARDDALVIEQLRAAGAILIGLTNMPPLAAGVAQVVEVDFPLLSDTATRVGGSGERRINPRDLARLKRELGSGNPVTYAKRKLSYPFRSLPVFGRGEARGHWK